MAYGPIWFQPAGDYPAGNTKIETYVSTPTLTLHPQRGREFHAPRGRFRGLESFELLLKFGKSSFLPRIKYGVNSSRNPVLSRPSGFPPTRE